MNRCCKCKGFCRGAEFVRVGEHCQLTGERDRYRTGEAIVESGSQMSTGQAPDIAEVLKKAEESLRKGYEIDLELMKECARAGIRIVPRDYLGDRQMSLEVSEQAYERLKRSTRDSMRTGHFDCARLFALIAPAK